MNNRTDFLGWKWRFSTLSRLCASQGKLIAGINYLKTKSRLKVLWICPYIPHTLIERMVGEKCAIYLRRNFFITYNSNKHTLRAEEYSLTVNTWTRFMLDVKSRYMPTILTSNGPYSVRPEQPTSVTYRSSSPGGVSGAKHPHQIFWHWAPSTGEISLLSPPGCSSVVSSPTATSIAQPWSRSEYDIAQKEDIPFSRCCLPFSGTSYFILYMYLTL